jgi:hypothetical protein
MLFDRVTIRVLIPLGKFSEANFEHTFNSSGEGTALAAIALDNLLVRLAQGTGVIDNCIGGISDEVKIDLDSRND